jgi:hypothetical protein
VRRDSRAEQMVSRLIRGSFQLRVSSHIHIQLSSPSQSVSPAFHGSTTGRTPNPARRFSKVANSIREVILRATRSPDPVKVLCASSSKEVPVMVNAIDEVRGSCMLRQCIYAERFAVAFT